MVATLLARPPRGSFNWRYISNDFDLTSSDTGVTQRVSKPGSRFEVSTTFRVRGADGMGYVALLNASKANKVRLPIPQMIDIGNPGPSARVNGANSGTTLRVKDLNAGYSFKAGQFLSVVYNGKRYLHQVVFPATATGSGSAELRVVPPLRAPVLGNEAVEIAAPTIEGFLQASTTEWVTDFIKSVNVSLTVREAE